MAKNHPNRNHRKKKNNLQKQEDIWHIQEMVYTPIKTSGQEFKNRVRTCSRGEEECRGLCQDTSFGFWETESHLESIMESKDQSDDIAQDNSR